MLAAVITIGLQPGQISYTRQMDPWGSVTRSGAHAITLVMNRWQFFWPMIL